MVVHRKKLGALAEQQACDFLQAKGLTVLEKNYRTASGEIDLIMRDDRDIVFIEVRSRKQSHYGSAVESINETKQRKILNTSLLFLQQRNWLDKVDCRFDVIGIDHGCIEWIRDAFTADIL